MSTVNRGISQYMCVCMFVFNGGVHFAGLGREKGRKTINRVIAMSGNIKIEGVTTIVILCMSTTNFDQITIFIINRVGVYKSALIATRCKVISSNTKSLGVNSSVEVFYLYHHGISEVIQRRQ